MSCQIGFKFWEKHLCLSYLMPYDITQYLAHIGCSISTWWKNESQTGIILSYAYGFTYLFTWRHTANGYLKVAWGADLRCHANLKRHQVANKTIKTVGELLTNQTNRNEECCCLFSIRRPSIRKTVKQRCRVDLRDNCIWDKPDNNH